jgi:tripartite-type tricarboxylate transporter receptor subunit TctC
MCPSVLLLQDQMSVLARASFAEAPSCVNSAGTAGNSAGPGLALSAAACFFAGRGARAEQFGTGSGEETAMRMMIRVAGLMLALTLSGRCFALDWPTRPVHVIVPFPAGGSADTLARLIGQDLEQTLGQPFVIENRTGAAGNIGTAAVAHAAPDGYTLLLTPSSIAIAPALFKDPGFNPEKDFVPVTLVGSIPMVIVVNPSFPARTLQELIAAAKAKPGQFNYASAGFGSTNHLATELFKSKTGIDLVHVPYRGNPLAVVDVISGHVPVFFDFVLTGKPHVQAGEVRALATTGAQRSSVLPDVPTVQQAGVAGFEASTWFGIYGPAGLSKDIVAQLDKTVAAALAKPTLRERLTGLGVDPMPTGPAALAKITSGDLVKWGPVIEKAGIKPE